MLTGFGVVLVKTGPSSFLRYLRRSTHNSILLKVVEFHEESGVFLPFCRGQLLSATYLARSWWGWWSWTENLIVCLKISEWRGVNPRGFRQSVGAAVQRAESSEAQSGDEETSGSVSNTFGGLWCCVSSLCHPWWKTGLRPWKATASRMKESMVSQTVLKVALPSMESARPKPMVHWAGETPLPKTCQLIRRSSGRTKVLGRMWSRAISHGENILAGYLASRGLNTGQCRPPWSRVWWGKFHEFPYWWVKVGACWYSCTVCFIHAWPSFFAYLTKAGFLRASSPSRGIWRWSMGQSSGIKASKEVRLCACLLNSAFARGLLAWTCILTNKPNQRARLAAERSERSASWVAMSRYPASLNASCTSGIRFWIPATHSINTMGTCRVRTTERSWVHGAADAALKPGDCCRELNAGHGGEAAMPCTGIDGTQSRYETSPLKCGTSGWLRRNKSLTSSLASTATAICKPILWAAHVQLPTPENSSTQTSASCTSLTTGTTNDPEVRGGNRRVPCSTACPRATYTRPICKSHPPSSNLSWQSVNTAGVWASSGVLGSPRVTSWVRFSGRGVNAMVVQVLGSRPGFHAFSPRNHILMGSGTSVAMALTYNQSTKYRRHCSSNRGACALYPNDTCSSVG